jgi:hypothetical protein
LASNPRYVLLGIPWLSWLICCLSITGAVVASWNADPKSSNGQQHLVAALIAVVVAILALVSGARLSRRVRAIEAGRYPRVDQKAWQRVASRLEGHNAQTVTIHGEGGDDIREVAAGLHSVLQAAHWDIREMVLGGTLWGAGRGIIVAHTMAAAPAAAALMESMTAEGLPVSYGGDSTTGFPVHIAFRRV